MDKAKVETVPTKRATRPEFERPPVVETSMGFFFSAIPQWSMRHTWLLWDRFRSEYPEPEFMVPLGEVELKLAGPQDLSHLPLRVWYQNRSRSKLLQVQNNLFLRNWRKTSESHSYEHYDACAPEYRVDWSKFLDFLASESLPRPQVNRCEITYFNHLVRGEDWSDISELSNLYRSWVSVRSEYPLSNPKMINISASYGLSDDTLLQITSQGAVRHSDGKEIIQLSVTATAPPKGQEDAQLFERLDNCHEAAVEGFLVFTTEAMHRRWGRRNR
jgi:uncharacterized protein (TIGR04255 family)